MPTRPLCALVFAACVGCGARTGLADGEPPPAGASGFVVRLVVFVNAHEHDWRAADETIVVEVEDSEGQPFTDAVVHAGPVGDAALVPYREVTSRYEVKRVGYTEVYAVSVDRGAEHVDATVVGPTPHETSINPDPVRVGEPATVRWQPSEPDIAVNVQVSGADASTMFDGEVPEQGAYEVPGKVFPAPGPYEVLVARQRKKVDPLGKPRSVGTVAMFDYHLTYAE